MLKKSTTTNRLMILAIIGVFFVLIIDTVSLADGLGFVSQSQLQMIIPILEIIAALGFVLIGLGFHKLYVAYGQTLCRIAFFGFILSPIILLMRLLPQLIDYNIWFYFAGNLVIPLLGALAFISLRSEGAVPFDIASVIVILGVLLDLFSYLLSFNYLTAILSFDQAIILRGAGRIPMWIFVGATFVWVNKKSRQIQSIGGDLELE